uniref:Uncharacterized protein n=1 Tax=Canis lupus dingo TaxID=286419 RepID=A0A8C0QXM8_CANLU
MQAFYQPHYEASKVLVYLTKSQPPNLNLVERLLKCGFTSPLDDWTGLDEDEDGHVWEDNWDDDNVEDDFNQL